MCTRLLQHPAHDVIALHGIAGLDVALHGSSPGPCRISEPVARKLHRRLTRRVTFAPRNLDVHVESALDSLASTGGRYDLTDVAPEQASGGSERREEHDLLPHVLLDIL